MRTVITDDLKNELSDLSSRARKIEYKNVIPSLPERPTDSTMSGFYKRFNNWKKGLFHLEGERIMQHETTYDNNPLKNFVTNKLK